MMHKSINVLALTVLLTSISAAGAFAQKPTLDSRLEVRFEATPAADVFRHVISGLGLELQLDARVDGPVTIWVKDVSARTALNVVCESLGCEWRVAANRLTVTQPGGISGKSDGKTTRLAVQKTDTLVRKKKVAFDLKSHLAKPLPVDMQFQNVPVSTILRALSEASGLEITADEPLASTRVTLSAKPRTVEGALKAVIDQAGVGKVGFMVSVASTDEPPSRVRIAIRSTFKK